MEKKGCENGLVRAAENAGEEVKKRLIDMAKGPGYGGLRVQMLGDKGQVRVTPCPDLTFTAEGLVTFRRRVKNKA